MQSRIQGYMYNITSETDYSERMLPPTPSREKEASPPIAARHVSSRAIIDEAPPRQPAPQQSQYRTDRPLVSSRAGASGAVFRRGSECQVAVCCTPSLCTSVHQLQTCFLWSTGKQSAHKASWWRVSIC